MEQKFDDLIKKLLTREITPSEQYELQRMVEENQAYKELYTTLYATSVQPSEEDITRARQAYAAHFARMQAADAFREPDDLPASSPIVPFYRRKTYLSIAAVLVFLASFGIIYWQQRIGDELVKPGNTVSTRKGSKSQIQLPDGTKVWLNADSKLSYVGDFSGHTREIELTGEAFFEVAKDPSRPFIIHTPAIDIKVLGTVFNVRSYPDEATTETALLEGKIEVTLNREENNKIILKPNEKLVVTNAVQPDAGHPAVSIETIDMPMLSVSMLRYNENDSIPTEAYWMKNKLAFDGESFEKVASKIERWYNVEVVIMNDSIRHKRFTGFFEGNTLQEVLEALSISGGIEFSIKGEKVFVQ